MASVCVCSDYFLVTDTGELCLRPGQQGLRELVIFGDPGVFQFRATDYPWLARVRVQVQGAGGGSAGANAAAGECIVRGGAAGGGWSESLIEASALGAVETVVVGAGGVAGSATSPGGPGGPSSFGGLVQAPGGDGGGDNMTSGTGPFAVPGQTAATAGTGQHISGGGAGHGAIRLNGGQALAGAGGESRLGHGGVARSSEGMGTTSRGRGGGAGGALSLGESVPGAPGGDGVVIVELYG